MIRQITINPCLNGFIVNVGCQTVVFESRSQLLRELDNYLAKPQEVEKRYGHDAIHKDLLNSPLVPAARPRIVETQQCDTAAPQTDTQPTRQP